jgi:hypothetical protein
MNSQIKENSIAKAETHPSPVALIEDALTNRYVDGALAATIAIGGAVAFRGKLPEVIEDGKLIFTAARNLLKTGEIPKATHALGNLVSDDGSRTSSLQRTLAQFRQEPLIVSAKHQGDLTLTIPEQLAQKSEAALAGSARARSRAAISLPEITPIQGSDVDISAWHFSRPVLVRGLESQGLMTGLTRLSYDDHFVLNAANATGLRGNRAIDKVPGLSTEPVVSALSYTHGKSAKWFETNLVFKPAAEVQITTLERGTDLTANKQFPQQSFTRTGTVSGVRIEQNGGITYYNPDGLLTESPDFRRRYQSVENIAGMKVNQGYLQAVIGEVRSYCSHTNQYIHWRVGISTEHWWGGQKPKDVEYLGKIGYSRR